VRSTSVGLRTTVENPYPVDSAMQAIVQPAPESHLLVDLKVLMSQKIFWHLSRGQKVS
jgi:hypothetical protein